MSDPLRQAARLSRRVLLVAPVGVAAAFRVAAASPQENASGNAMQQRLNVLEGRHGGRLGVAVLDLGSGRHVAYRGGERFAMCSTHKLLTAGFVLARVDQRAESLDRRVAYGSDILVPHSPATEKHVGNGMTIAELCDAALTLSDNTAANLLLDSFGGPAQLTAYLRTLGDDVTRLDRREPELNTALAGDPRDTTTPFAMLQDIRRLVLGAALSPASRSLLTAWLLANKTGDNGLHAGLPTGWRIGDRTGAGDNNTGNDVGVIWPPAGAPIIVTAFYTQSTANTEQRDAVLAEVGKAAAMIR